MADIKRKFYNTGDAKDFTKAVFYKTVLAMANGEEVEDDLVDLVAQACEYELEGIANRPKNTKTGEAKDPLQSDYAIALRKAILPFLTSNPATANDLVEKATSAGKIAPSGKPFSAPWVARVLKVEDGVACVKAIVEKTNAKGLKSQVEVNAFKRV